MELSLPVAVPALSKQKRRSQGQRRKVALKFLTGISLDGGPSSPAKSVKIADVQPSGRPQGEERSIAALARDFSRKRSLSQSESPKKAMPPVGELYARGFSTGGMSLATTEGLLRPLNRGVDVYTPATLRESHISSQRLVLSASLGKVIVRVFNVLTGGMVSLFCSGSWFVFKAASRFRCFRWCPTATTKGQSFAEFILLCFIPENENKKKKRKRKKNAGTNRHNCITQRCITQRYYITRINSPTSPNFFWPCSHKFTKPDVDLHRISWCSCLHLPVGIEDWPRDQLIILGSRKVHVQSNLHRRTHSRARTHAWTHTHTCMPTHA